MDYDTASIVGGVFDPRRKEWDVSACAALGLDVGLLPPLAAATDVVGGVTLAAAQATGLRPGTPVIAGTGDTFPTIVGCGAVTPGDAMISFGTTGLFTLTTGPLEQRRPDRTSRRRTRGRGRVGRQRAGLRPAAGLVSRGVRDLL